MNDASFAPISNDRETGISNKTLSCIKAESEKVVLAPRKPRGDDMNPCDFKPHVPLFSIFQSTVNGIDEPIYRE